MAFEMAEEKCFLKFQNSLIFIENPARTVLNSRRDILKSLMCQTTGLGVQASSILLNDQLEFITQFCTGIISKLHIVRQKLECFFAVEVQRGAKLTLGINLAHVVYLLGDFERYLLSKPENHTDKADHAISSYYRQSLSLMQAMLNEVALYPDRSDKKLDILSLKLRVLISMYNHCTENNSNPEKASNLINKCFTEHKQDIEDLCKDWDDQSCSKSARDIIKSFKIVLNIIANK